MFTVKNLKTSSIIFIVVLLVSSTISLVVSYIFLERSQTRDTQSNQESITDNYAVNLMRSLSFYAAQINYGREFMKRYSIYNSTLTDFIDLSSQNSTNVAFFASDIRALYNISQSEVPAFTQRMIELVPDIYKTPNLTIRDIAANGSFVPAAKRSWYCPLLYASPIADGSYVPGVDLCALTSFTIINKIVKSDYTTIIIEPRTSQRSSFVVLDLAQKNPQGFTALTLNMSNIINSIVEQQHNVRLQKDGVIFFDDCMNCAASDTWTSANVTLPNNESLNIYVSFQADSYDPTEFVYILIGVVVLNIIFILLTIRFEVETNRFLLADKMLGYVNHEVRNPLNCIDGLIEIALIDLEPLRSTYSEVFSNLETAKQACEMLTHIVNDILDIKKLNDGKLAISKTQINIPDLIRNMMRIIHSKLCEHPDIQFHFLNPQDIVFVYTDYHRLFTDSFKLYH